MKDVVTVREVTWKMNCSNGEYYPIAHVASRQDIDRAPLLGIDMAFEVSELQSGNVLEFKGWKFQLAPDVELTLPRDCAECDCQLEWFVFEGRQGKSSLVCNFDSCTGKSMTSMYRMFLHCQPKGSVPLPYDLIYQYLTHFPTELGGTVNVLDVLHAQYGLITFLQLFAQAGSKTIASRRLALEKAFQGWGNALWNLEKALEGKLLIEGFTYQEFWHFVSLPQVYYYGSQLLSKVNPLEIRDLMNEEKYEAVNEILDNKCIDPQMKSSVILCKPHWSQIAARVKLKSE